MDVRITITDHVAEVTSLCWQTEELLTVSSLPAMILTRVQMFCWTSPGLAISRLWPGLMAQWRRSPTQRRLGQDLARAETERRVRGMTSMLSWLEGSEITSLLTWVRGFTRRMSAMLVLAAVLTVMVSRALAWLRMEWRAVRPVEAVSSLAGELTEERGRAGMVR